MCVLAQEEYSIFPHVKAVADNIHILTEHQYQHNFFSPMYINTCTHTLKHKVISLLRAHINFTEWEMIHINQLTLTFLYTPLSF